MGTFRTYTVKVEGNDITFKNLTIENNAAPLGQAVALHTEGDRLMFIHCRLLGNQDTIYTGREGTRLLFTDCYIEGTTDFIFGPATALFERCTIHSKRNSYITAASGVHGVRMLLLLSSIANLVAIFALKAGITGAIKRMRKLPVMRNSVIQVKAQPQPAE